MTDDVAYAERFAIEHAHYDRDLEFWIEAGKRSGGPVLDIGCASGRVTLALAQAGLDVWAIDQSRAMLDVLARRATEGDVINRIELREADMRHLDLGRPFALAIIPMNTFQLMHEPVDQLAALSALHRHLVPGGELVLEVARPDFLGIERSIGELVPAGAHLDTERHVLMLHSSRYDALDVETRRVTFTLRIDERAEDGSNAVFTREFDVRLFSEGELRGLLQEAGFEVLDVYGDFDLSSPSDESELQLFRCKAA